MALDSPFVKETWGLLLVYSVYSTAHSTVDGSIMECKKRFDCYCLALYNIAMVNGLVHVHVQAVPDT